MHTITHYNTWCWEQQLFYKTENPFLEDVQLVRNHSGRFGQILSTKDLFVSSQTFRTWLRGCNDKSMIFVDVSFSIYGPFRVKIWVDQGLWQDSRSCSTYRVSKQKFVHLNNIVLWSSCPLTKIPGWQEQVENVSPFFLIQYESLFVSLQIINSQIFRAKSTFGHR